MALLPPSLQMLHDVCELNDLMDLARESNPCSDDHTSEGRVTPFKSKSDFYPMGSRGKDLDLFQKLVGRDLTNLVYSHRRSHTQDNLTDTEKTLNEDTNIISKNEDKIGLLVIFDSTTYKEEAVRQPSDTVTYFKLRGDPTMSFKQGLIGQSSGNRHFFTKRERYIHSRFSYYACVSFSPKSA